MRPMVAPVPRLCPWALPALENSRYNAGREALPMVWVPAACPTCDHAARDAERRSCLQRALLL